MKALAPLNYKQHPLEVKQYMGFASNMYGTFNYTGLLYGATEVDELPWCLPSSAPPHMSSVNTKYVSQKYTNQIYKNVYITTPIHGPHPMGN